jgi:hypothetical protein
MLLGSKRDNTHHMFATCHQLLIDDFGSIVATSVDVDAFFDDGIGAGSQRLSNLVPTRLDLRLLTGLRIHVGIVTSELGRRGDKRKIAMPRRAFWGKTR